MTEHQQNYMNLIDIIGFVIGLMNLQENLTQGDKQEIMDDLSSKADKLLTEIHQHLQTQDDKIDKILELLQRGEINDINTRQNI